MTFKSTTKIPKLWFCKRLFLTFYYRNICDKLCINEAKKSLPDLDYQCRKNVNNSNFCPYTKNSKAVPPAFFPGHEYDKYDIEDIKDYGREHSACPYFMTRAILRQAEYIFCPYNYVLDEAIRSQMKLDLTNSIVLIDEGHNIENVCRDAASLAVTIDDVAIMSSQLHNLVDDEARVVEIGSSLSNAVRSILVFVDKLLDWLRKNEQDKPWSSALAANPQQQFFRYHDVQLVLSGWSMTNAKWPLYSADIDVIIESNEKSNSAADVFVQYIPDNVAVVLSEFALVFRAIFVAGCLDDYALIVTNFDEKLTVKLLCMSPAVAFSTLTHSTHSIVLTSGTLSPLDQYESELRVRFPHKVSAKHVIDPMQVNAMIVTQLDGVPMTSANKALTSSEGRKIYAKLGEMMLVLVRSVPDGVLLFFPSSKIMRDCLSAWGDVKEQIKRAKPLFIDAASSKANRRANSADVFKEYKSSVNQGNGGLLLGVIRGKLSEGIDFIDKQARAVVVFGVPYPSFFSPEVFLKRDYNDNHMCKDEKERNPHIFYTSSGMEWYSAQAYRALAQAIGRCIRHQDDYGSVILVDQRYPQDKRKFPLWIQNSLRDREVTQVAAIETKLRDFYDAMLQKFPNSRAVQTEFNENDPIVVTHAECLNKLVRVVRLEKTGTFNTNSQCLAEIFAHDVGNGPIVLERVRPGDSVRMDAKIGGNVWAEKDGLGYQPIMCQCGAVVGVHVHAATEEPNKVRELGADYFYVERCYVTQRKLSDQMSAYVIKPKEMKMIAAEDGQKKISFG